MNWTKILEVIGLQILSYTRLAPIAPAIIAGIHAVEGIPGATGPQKKAIVQSVVQLGAETTNQVAGSTVLDPTEAVTISGSVIDAIVGVTNAIHRATPPALQSAPPPVL